jgi:hypothetical protein
MADEPIAGSRGTEAVRAPYRLVVCPTDPSSDPGYWATIARVLQAVPRVCDAGPGILGRIVPDLHWVPDFRELSAASPLNCVAMPL